MNIRLRPVEDRDDALLLELYASTRETELAMTPWTPEQKRAFVTGQFDAQKRHYAGAYPAGTHQVICLGEEPAGRLYLSRQADRFHILDLTIAPARRNAGIGSAVLLEILREAGLTGKPVSIYVETFNPSLRLFERLGFQQVSVDGFLVLMERGAATSA